MPSKPSANGSEAQGIFSHEQLGSCRGDVLLRAVVNGEFEHPPIYRTMGITIVHVGSGKVTLEATASAAFVNPMGLVHGGYVSTLLDACMGCAIHSRLPKGVTYTTIELKANFVRALKQDVSARAEGRVIHLGRRIATAEGWLLDAAGTLYAHGTCTCAILSLASPRGRDRSSADTRPAAGNEELKR